MRIFEFLECVYNTRVTYRLFQIGNLCILLSHPYLKYLITNITLPWTLLSVLFYFFLINDNWNTLSSFQDPLVDIYYIWKTALREDFDNHIVKSPGDSIFLDFHLFFLIKSESEVFPPFIRNAWILRSRSCAV